jgi:hypothetical protein
MRRRSTPDDPDDGWTLVTRRVSLSQLVEFAPVGVTDLPESTDEGGREWVQYDAERLRLTELGREALKTAHMVFAYARRSKPVRLASGKKALIPISIVKGTEYAGGPGNLKTLVTLHVMLDGTARRLNVFPKEATDLDLLGAACAAANDPNAPWG